MSKTPAERVQCAISDPREREALVLLSEAGWTHAELAMCFELSEAAVSRVCASTSPVGVIRS